MSNLRTYYHFKLDFQEVDRNTGVIMLSFVLQTTIHTICIMLFIKTWWHHQDLHVDCRGPSVRLIMTWHLHVDCRGPSIRLIMTWHLHVACQVWRLWYLVTHLFGGMPGVKTVISGGPLVCWHARCEGCDIWWHTCLLACQVWRLWYLVTHLFAGMPGVKAVISGGPLVPNP